MSPHTGYPDLRSNHYYAGADIKEPLDPVPLGRRKLRPADRVHYTVSDRQRERYNNPPASHPRETAADEQQTGG